MVERKGGCSTPEAKLELRAASQLGSDDHRPPMLAHDLAYDRQTEPCPTRSPGAEKRLEYPLYVVRRDAGAVVADLDRHCRCRDPNGSRPAHRLTGVAHKVGQGTGKSNGI